MEPVADITDSTGYRDSILDDNDAIIDDDTQPLLTSDSNAKYKQIEWTIIMYLDTNIDPSLPDETTLYMIHVEYSIFRHVSANKNGQHLSNKK